MSEDAKDIRVEEVMQRLKEEVREQRLRTAQTLPKAGPVDLEKARAVQWVNPHLPIAWPNWPPGILPKLAALTKKVVRWLLRWYINPIVEQQNEFNEAALDALEMLSAPIEMAAAQVAAGRQEIQRWKSVRTRWYQEAGEVSMRLSRLERLVRGSPMFPEVGGKNSQKVPSEMPSDGTAGPGTAYFHMEWKYRPPTYLEEKQKDYVRYYTGCKNVLDIGCGRGDFVQMLLDAGIGAHGIELEPNAVAYAQEHGRSVQLADALTYLAELPDSSLDGVFLAQVAEHLTPSYLISLLELCYRKMQPKALLIAETINPVCLWALANWYLIDPTHVRPVHPETMRFILESTGFSNTEIRYLSPVPEEDKLVELHLAEGAGSEFRGMIERINSNVKRLNDFLYGFQEYVAVAQRAPDNDRADTYPVSQPEEE